MRLRARIIEGTDVWYDRDFYNNKYRFEKTINEDICISADYMKPQEAFNVLYDIGKVLWDADMCSKFEIAAFDENGQLFWKHRPDQYNFERNKYLNCFDEIIKEEYNAFSSPDFQNDKSEMDYLQDYQKRFWNKHHLYSPEYFKQTIRDTQLFENMKVIRPLVEYNDINTEKYDIGFEHNGTMIINPFYDETLRFEVEPLSYYGIENIEKYASQFKEIIEDRSSTHSFSSSLDEKIAVAKAVPGKERDADKHRVQRDDEERM